MNTYIQKNEKSKQQGIQEDSLISNTFTESQQEDLIRKEEEEEEIYQKQEQICKDYRYKTKNQVLFLTGIFSVGIMYYNQNFPGLLKDEIMQDTDTHDIEQFQLFQTLSFGPVIPFILLGGVLLDVIGIAMGMTIYMFTMLVGAWIVAVGGGLDSFWVLIIGKIFFSIGLEMGSSAESSLLAKWYSGGKLSIYNGAYLAMARFAQLLASLCYPRLYDVFNNLFFPMTIAALVCTLCFILAEMAPVMDFIADRQKKKIQKKIIVKKGSNKNFKFSDIKKFNLLYWIVIMNFVISYSVYFPFISNIKDVLKKFSFSSTQAGDLQSIIYLIGLLSPLFGFGLKKYGKNFEVLMFSIVCGIGSFAYLLFSTPCEEVCFDKLIPFVILFGLYLTLFPVVLIPAIAMAAPPDLLGSAYGFAYCLKNVGEATVPLILIGPLLENYPIDSVILCFLIMAFVQLSLAIVLWYYHKKETKKLKKHKKSLIVSQINDNEQESLNQDELLLQDDEEK